MKRNGTQGENVGRLGDFAGIGNRLGRHVNERLRFDQILHIRYSGRGRSRLSDADLPVIDLKRRDDRIGVGDKDALGAQRPMNDPLAMGIADCVGDLPQQTKPLVRRQLVAMRSEVMIEADGVRVEIPEEQSRAKFVFLVVQHWENARMGEALDDLEFTSRCPLESLAVFFGRSLGDGVLPHSAEHILEGSMFGQPVLISRPVCDQVAEHVIAYPPRSLRRSNTGLLHGSRQGLGYGTVNRVAQTRVDSRPFSVHQGGNDAFSIRLILQANTIPAWASQVALEIVG